MHRTITDHQAQRVRRSLRSLLASHPYFGSLALRLPIIPDPSREDIIATDGRSLRFNPEGLESLTHDEIKVRIADCVLGCALGHHTRRGDRDYARWQQAHWMVTLPLLRDAGLTDERGGRGDLSIERAYDLIPPRPEDDGSGGGRPAPGAGEIMDAPTPDDPAERQSALKREEQEWDTAGRQAFAMARAEGREPGSIAELIDSRHNARQPWRDILRSLLVSFAPRDYSWSRPNRRFAGSGIYLPSLTGEAMPPIIFAIDTSGSLDTEALAYLWAELRLACEETSPEAVTIIQCDSRIGSIRDYHPAEMPDEIEITGRGGTAFSPVMAHIAERDPAPACLIYLTDGRCSDYGSEPDCPVVWAIEPAGAQPFAPPFGIVIHLEDAA